MGKKPGKAINPADAHRKAQRKKELKKNKEDRKKVRLYATAQKDTKKIFEELQALQRAERLDQTQHRKKQQLAEKLKKINESRKELGLAPIDPNAPPVSQPKPKVDDVEMKWYHPTFNPHGPKKPAGWKEESSSGSGSESSEESEEESSEEGGSEAEDAPTPKRERDDASPSKTDAEPALKFSDLAYIPLPSSPAGKNAEAQIYHTLELPEIRNKADYMPTEAGGGAQNAVRPPLPQHPVMMPPPHMQQGFGAYPPPPPPFRPGMPMPSHFAPPHPFPPPFPHNLPPGPPPGGPPPFRPPFPYGMAPPPHFARPPPPPPFGFQGRPMPPYPYPMPPPQFGAPPPHLSAPPAPPSHEAGHPSPTQQPQPQQPKVIAAAPKLRDLHAESVKLVPTALRRKKPAPSSKARLAATPGSATSQSQSQQPSVIQPSAVKKPRVNAAPDVENPDTMSGISYTAFPTPATTVGTGKVLPTLQAVTAAKKKDGGEKTKGKTANDEYEEFMRSMEDLL
ncbi:uncharacterized protein EV422DRAFT_77186 [Fimicolochytrium jonesii]|uniref:uncharacterized protein n=1 Tax=Fimicolochytrium jonesii TaxID=1396493 RepID=UPI0022FEC5C4|nr:uncharacterized protein EV422DRAFT_77186 [Fimicolochytrium jonesii]KAI8820582.1 hypothetical protein EV422DRAFT_77186 [Fimicolochytrium jonesii]